MKFVGDKVNFNDLGLAHWGGVFGLAEYKREKLSAFLNLTTAMNGYKKADHFTGKESDMEMDARVYGKNGCKLQYQPAFQLLCQYRLVIQNP